MRAHTVAILGSYSEVLFYRGWPMGLLLATVTLISPDVAGAGLVAVVAAYAFARFIGMQATFLESGFYTYNPLLVGLSIGYLFQLTPLTAFFVVVAGVCAFVVTHIMHHLLGSLLRLPILSVPFVLVSSTAYLAASQYTNLHVRGLYPVSRGPVGTALPMWLSGFFESLGAIFFMPHLVAGICIALGLLLVSRILLLLAFTGYLAGATVLALLAGSAPAAFSNPNAFNFILIAMALGGVFLVPSPRAYSIAMIAVVVSTLPLSSTEVFWSQYGLPAFALPFNLVTLTFVYLLTLVDHPLVARPAGATPEEALDAFLAGRDRFPGTLRTLALPFHGEWSVWQGCDGPWTHRGPWRHACDFVLRGEDGNTYRGPGDRLEHYLAYRKPVLAPVRGRVAKIVAELPDNPVGESDRQRSWGNLVILADERGFFVELSHFAQGSIRVVEGQWVERGALLGLCGNSGNSPEPHIHVQVQATDRVGAATLPFSFVAYRAGDSYHGNDMPLQGERIATLAPERDMESRLGFVLDEQFVFEVSRNGRPAGRTQHQVRAAHDGTLYFESARGRLFFGRFEDTFYCHRVEGDDPWLRTLFLAAPRLPLAFHEGLRWSDRVPAAAARDGLRSLLFDFLRSFHHGLGRVDVELASAGDAVFDGIVRSRALAMERSTRVEIHPRRGFQSIRVGEMRMQRIEEADPVDEDQQRKST